MSHSFHPPLFFSSRFINQADFHSDWIVIPFEFGKVSSTVWIIPAHFITDPQLKSIYLARSHFIFGPSFVSFSFPKMSFSKEKEKKCCIFFYACLCIDLVGSIARYPSQGGRCLVELAFLSQQTLLEGGEQNIHTHTYTQGEREKKYIKSVKVE